MEEKKVSEEFKKKIKTVDELCAVLGEPPRKKNVVMCHGCFDIVHPGHIRHLIYAKERADILVASLTCDAHIYKGDLRPYVPEGLRAFNLAALQFVDYVVIDYNDTPLDTLRKLKPDYFAKGFDYFGHGIPPKTREEIAVLESYGGEILFTPGDVVYSSSNLIETALPRLEIAKLHILMEQEQVTFADLRNALDKFAGIKVHVLGDTIVDSYTRCRTNGSMTKTPTVSVQVESQANYNGGAAIVAKHIQKAGGQVTFSTVLGNDELKEFVLQDLKDSGVTCDAVIDKTRPTTQKNAYVCQGYHLLRVSKLDNRIISEKIRKHLCESLANSKSDAYVFSDFRHGLFNRANIPSFVESIPQGAFKVADSQVASRWGNILEFQGFDLLTPNEREARFALGDQDSVVRPLAQEIYNRAHCKYLILKLGERGIMTYRHSSAATRGFFTIDSFTDRVVDAVGAGDALLAYATLALHATHSIVIASILGSLAAAIACEREGNIPIERKEVLEKIEAVEKRMSFS